jgi:hypothetical protein
LEEYGNYVLTKGLKMEGKIEDKHSQGTCKCKGKTVKEK